MKCSKCGNEIKSGNKFCTKCGSAVESSTTLELSNEKNKYTIQKNCDALRNYLWQNTVGGVTVIILSLMFNFFNIYTLVLVVCMFFLLPAILGSNNLHSNIILFKCPNCNEEITLKNGFTTINNEEFTNKCPKCNKDLIFNNKELSVRLNELQKTTHNESDNKGDTDILEELFNLKTKGIITEEEFEQKKKELLNKM